MNNEDLEPWILPNGARTRLGNFAPPPDMILPVRGSLPDIPESEWRGFDFRSDSKYPVKIKNQGSYGACNGHAAASSLEDARYIAGLEHTDLSAWMIYADLCGGWDRGSVIAEALKLLQDRGTCEDTLVNHGIINPSRLSSEAQANRKRYRIEIGYRLTSFRELCIAAMLRLPFNFSVPVNSNYNSLDKNGCPQNRSGWHNHAVQGGCGLKRLPTGEWAILKRNSWGDAWGLKGFCWIKESNIQGNGFDAYAVQAVEVDPENQPPIIA